MDRRSGDDFRGDDRGRRFVHPILTSSNTEPLGSMRRHGSFVARDFDYNYPANSHGPSTTETLFRDDYRERDRDRDRDRDRTWRNDRERPSRYRESSVERLGRGESYRPRSARSRSPRGDSYRSSRPPLTTDTYVPSSRSTRPSSRSPYRGRSRSQSPRRDRYDDRDNRFERLRRTSPPIEDIYNARRYREDRERFLDSERSDRAFSPRRGNDRRDARDRSPVRARSPLRPRYGRSPPRQSPAPKRYRDDTPDSRIAKRERAERFVATYRKAVRFRDSFRAV